MAVRRFPEPPDGSRFTLGPAAEGRPRLRWSSVNKGHGGWRGFGVLTLGLCVWAVGEVFASSALLGWALGWEGVDPELGGIGLLFLFGWLGGWTVGGFFAWRSWLTLVLAPRAESITFRDGELVYRAGLAAADAAGADACHVFVSAVPLWPYRIRREQVEATLRLEPVGGRQRLSIDRGADRVEVGAVLSQPEREWLHHLLREWAGGGELAPAWRITAAVPPVREGKTREPDQEPPEGSCFTQDRTAEGRSRICWPSDSGSGLARWGMAAGLAFWLCGWVAGEVNALARLGWGPSDAGDLDVLFLTVWVVAWTVGGLFMMGALYAVVRSKWEESVMLGNDALAHEPGFCFSPDRQQDGSRSPSCPRPRTVRREEVAAGLRLDRASERQRLIVECGADLVEIGPALREPEREWLHRVLTAWAGGTDERVFSPEDRVARK